MASSAILGQSPLTTTFAGDEQMPSGQVFFDLHVHHAITLQSIAVNTSSDAGTQGLIEVWLTVPGITSFAGQETQPASWSLASTGTCVSAGPNQQSNACLQTPLPLAAQDYGVAVRYIGLAPRMSLMTSSYQGPTAIASNQDLSLWTGGAQQVPFTSNTLHYHSFDGSLAYYQGTNSYPCAGVAAKHSTIGAGCQRQQTSFYHMMSTVEASSTLSNSALTMVPIGTGYVLQLPFGAAFQNPSSAATTLTGFWPDNNDGEIAISLPTPLLLGDGSTTQILHVHTNGIIATGPIHASLTASNTPSVTDLLEAPFAAWYCWHDYTPNAYLSGYILTELVGNLFCITWNGVESSPASVTNPSTFQMQFDLNTGFVNFVWGSITPISNVFKNDPHLIGYSNSGPSLDHGPTPIPSIQAEVLHATHDQLPLTLTASPLPMLGHTVGYTTHNPTNTTGIGTCIFSVEGVHALWSQPIDLSSYGADDCYAYVNLRDGYPNMIGSAGGLSMTVPITIPVRTALIGFTFSAQSAWIDDNANAAGLVTSNLVRSQVGAF